MSISSSPAASHFPGNNREPFVIINKLLRNRDSLLESIFSRQDLGLICSVLLLACILLLGCYGAITGWTAGWIQVGSSALKLPLLYLLSLIICFPVLYIINTLIGSRLGLLQTMTMILMPLALNALILACFAPIILFFAITGSDYHFLKLLHVGVMTFSGLWAMGVLYRGLVSMCEHSSVYPRTAVRILLLWMMVFGFVGTQMAWTLRPFLGAPDLKFEFIRKAGPGNFYKAVWISIKSLN